MFESLEQFQLHILVTIGSALLVTFLLRFVILRLIYLIARSWRVSRMSFEVLRKHYFPSLYIFLGLFVYDVAAFALELRVPESLFNSLAVLSFTWVVAKTITLISMIVYRKFTFGHRDNIRERKIHTQAIFLERILVALVWIIGISFALLSVDEVKGIGNKILASAGIASVVVGFAAQKGIANLIAGFQIAFTQPMRIDDVVIVEGEWGRIEEITLTYVVVKIWDNRRMVLPVTYFTQQPFQNWTRSSSDLLGSVTFWADYNLDTEKLRQEMKPLIEESDLWNGDFWNLQVIETSENAMQLRILVTADDASDAWDLRCEVREKVLSLIRQTQPEALPRLRLERETET